MTRDSNDSDTLEAGTRVVYDRPEEPGRGEAVVRESGVDDWERWYRAEDTESGEELSIGESSVITTNTEETDP